MRARSMPSPPGAFCPERKSGRPLSCAASLKRYCQANALSDEPQRELDRPERPVASRWAVGWIGGQPEMTSHAAERRQPPSPLQHPKASSLLNLVQQAAVTRYRTVNKQLTSG